MVLHSGTLLLGREWLHLVGIHSFNNGNPYTIHAIQDFSKQMATRVPIALPINSTGGTEPSDVVKSGAVSEPGTRVMGQCWTQYPVRSGDRQHRLLTVSRLS
jgi:hypothetical protein